MRVVPAQNPTENGEQRLSLECLKFQGETALACSDIPGLKKVVLRELHVRFENLTCESIAHFSNDIFHPHQQDPETDLFSPDSTITRAVFDLYFADSSIPHSVVIEPPFTIQPAQLSNTELTLRWVSLCGFVKPKESSSVSDEQSFSIA